MKASKKSSVKPSTVSSVDATTPVPIPSPPLTGSSAISDPGQAFSTLGRTIFATPELLCSLPLSDVLDLLADLATLDPRLVSLSSDPPLIRATSLVPGWTHISATGPTPHDALWSLEGAISRFLSPLPPTP